MAYELRGLLIKLEVHKKHLFDEPEVETTNNLEFAEIPTEIIDEYNDEFPGEGRRQIDYNDDQYDFDEENIDFD